MFTISAFSLTIQLSTSLAARQNTRCLTWGSLQISVDADGHLISLPGTGAGKPAVMFSSFKFFLSFLGWWKGPSALAQLSTSIPHLRSASDVPSLMRLSPNQPPSDSLRSLIIATLRSSRWPRPSSSSRSSHFNVAGRCLPTSCLVCGLASEGGGALAHHDEAVSV